MSQPNTTGEGQITKYDPNGSQLTTAKAPILRFGNTVETRYCKQTFGFQGPDDSRHASRALDIIEKMNKK